MTQVERIDFRIHIPIICALLLCQYFSSDIFAYFYLRTIERRFIASKPLDSDIYLSGEYTPLLKKDPYLKLPRDYRFVFVKRSGYITEEVYYTKKGKKVKATYLKGEVEEISGETIPYMASLILPLVGFLICLFAILHDAVRTGEMFSWKIGKAPDKIEKICYLYGLPLFVSGFLFGAIRNF